jgi:hypothetical protein
MIPLNRHNLITIFPTPNRETLYLQAVKILSMLKLTKIMVTVTHLHPYLFKEKTNIVIVRLILSHKIRRIILSMQVKVQKTVSMKITVITTMAALKEKMKRQM